MLDNSFLMEKWQNVLYIIKYHRIQSISVFVNANKTHIITLYTHNATKFLTVQIDATSHDT